MDQTRTLKERAHLDHGKPSEDFLLVKGKMASKNVEEDLEEYTEELYPTAEFKAMVDQGFYNEYDGKGFYHDGFQQLDELVVLSDIRECFPYVIWYAA